MNIFVTRKILAKVHRHDGADKGCVSLSPG